MRRFSFICVAIRKVEALLAPIVLNAKISSNPSQHKSFLISASSVSFSGIEVEK